MKKTFMTFGSESISDLNDQIYKFAEENCCEEVERSRPVISCFNNSLYITVNSTFVSLESIKSSKISLDDPIEVLNLSTRTNNCLLRGRVDTVGKLLEIPKKTFMEFKDANRKPIRNLGMHSVDEVLKALSNVGLEMK